MKLKYNIGHHVIGVIDDGIDLMIAYFTTSTFCNYVTGLIKQIRINNLLCIICTRMSVISYMSFVHP